jgi:DNA-binding NarL/FixJ family response regulator
MRQAPTMTISVSIVEDDAALRQTLALCVNVRGFRCASTHGNAEEAIRLLPQVAPDVVLVDICLPGMSGIDCIRELQPRLPASKCIVLTAFDQTDLVFEALSAGALGYLLKALRPEKLLESIREVHEGGSPMSNSIARKVVAHFHAASTTRGKPVKPPSRSTPLPLDGSGARGEGGGAVADIVLSAREKQVLDYLTQGLAYKQIGSRLGVSMPTVRFYVQNIYKKLHVHSRMEAVAKLSKK